MKIQSIEMEYCKNMKHIEFSFLLHDIEHMTSAMLYL